MDEKSKDELQGLDKKIKKYEKDPHVICLGDG